MRVEHQRDASNSSYSSLHSDWQTINSEDEKMRSFSLNTNNGGNVSSSNNRHTPDNMAQESPFEIKEEPQKEEASKLEETPNKKSLKNDEIDEEEQSNNSK